jgi:tetratricopeptide (TPR) repeat protein
VLICYSIRVLRLILLCVVASAVWGGGDNSGGVFAAGTHATRGAAGPGFAGSSSCRECHEKFYQLWSTSFHGTAMQPYTAELAHALAAQETDIAVGDARFRADLTKGVVIERGPGGEKEYPIQQALGGKDVFYFLTPLDRGRLQVLPVAYDVRRKEWFNTTASAMRHFSDHPDEALDWKERPLTFNTSCYSCHVSQLSRNYDLNTDSYHTTWAEPGINCETCHGPGADHVQLFHRLAGTHQTPADLKLVVPRKLSVDRRNDLCATCHARLSPLTASTAPGDRFFDHFDLTTFENADFYPDGRDLGENYTFTLWRLSPCVKAGGLDCVRCHTSSGRYRFAEPASANEACLPCHEGKVRNAPAHTHHKIGSAGNKCISCHMPTTEFARIRRTDHSMRPPAPSATLAYGSPNACNLCHTNENAGWADNLVRQWCRRDYQKPVLERAALIAAARKGDWKHLPEILAYLSGLDREEIETTSLVRLLAECPDPSKWPVLRSLIKDSSPLVRSAAATALGGLLDPTNVTALIAATGDDYRLVRVRAAEALAPVSAEFVPEAKRDQVRRAMDEEMQSLTSRPDEMTSHYNLGNLELVLKRVPEAVEEFETAMRLDPGAVPPSVNAALACNALGQNDKAERYLRKALRLDPTNAVVSLNLGMLLAEMDRLPEAEQSFRAALKNDPHSAQAAYNLAVLLSRSQPEEAVQWSRKAAQWRPDEPKYAYSAAFFLRQQGKFAEAQQVLQKLIVDCPSYAEGYALLGQMLQEQRKTTEAMALYRTAAANTNLTSAERFRFQARIQELSGN